MWVEMKQYGRLDWKEATWASPTTRYMTIIPNKDNADIKKLKETLSKRYKEFTFSIGVSICNNIISEAIHFYVDVKN